MDTASDKKILAFVGMPGAGKSEAAKYLEQKGIPFVRFGDVTDDALKEMNLSITAENEKFIREKIRKELGMGAYAMKLEPRIADLTQKNPVIALDGLRSWEEYTFLKEKFPGLILITVYAEPVIRYTRLSNRPVRPLEPSVSRKRDIAELEGLNMGGPIAIADYLIENGSENVEELHKKIDELLVRLKIQ